MGVYQKIRRQIKDQISSIDDAKSFLESNIGIDVTKKGVFKVRPEERTPSCVINKDGSFHDFGSGEHYSDIVSLLYDGYHAFDSLSATMQWICDELNIDMEAYDE